MKCDQCDRPGLYDYGNGKRLCLPCHALVEDLRLRNEENGFRQQLINLAMLNEANDAMDAVAPWAATGARIPVAAIAAAATRGTKMTNIHISGSQVGVLNTGDLAKIDAMVTLTKGSDAEEFGAAMKSLTEAVVQSQDMQADTKREVGELLAALTEQVVVKRSKPVAMTVLQGIEDRTQGINAVWDLVVKVGGLVGLLLAAS